ncbi:MAG: DUF2341 domain-containing protein [Nanobdellota archaeon]
MLNKKEDNILNMRVFFLVILLFLLFIPFVIASDVEIKLSTDQNYYNLGETVKVSAECFIQGVKVLSVPLDLQVTDPLDSKKRVDMTGNTNGVYKGSFQASAKGTYEVTASVDIRGKKYEQTKQLEVVSSRVKLDIDVPSKINYESGPLDITGSIKIMDMGSPLDKNINIMLRSPSSPYYNKLCDVDCKGKCRFSCRMSKNIEIADYYIVAKTTHDGAEHIAKDKFSVVFKETEGLDVEFENKKTFLNNETQAISINATLNGKPLRDAMLNLKVIRPDNSTRNYLTDEVKDGQYVKSYVCNQPGVYQVQTTVSKGNIYGKFVSNYTVIEKDRVIKLSKSEKALDIKTGNFWKISKIESKGKDVLIDLSEFLSKNIDLSNVYLFGDERIKLNVSRALLKVEKKLLKRLGDSFIIEGRLKSSAEPLSIAYEKSLHSIGYSFDKVSGIEKYRVQLSTGENRSPKFIIDNDFNIINSWTGKDEVLFYTEKNKGKLYTSSALENASAIVNSGISSNEALQGESIIFKPAMINDLFNTTVSIYDDAGVLVENSGFSDSYNFETDNNTEPGFYYYILKAKAKNASDILLGRLRVLSINPGVKIMNRTFFELEKNSYVKASHSIINNNYKESDIVELTSSSNFTDVVFFDSSGNKLKDTDKDGFVDTGEIGPGEQKEIFAKLSVPSDVAVDSYDFVNITAISGTDNSIKSSVVDEVKVVPFVDEKAAFTNDLSILSIKNFDSRINVKVKNNYNRSKIARVRLDANYSLGSERQESEIERLIQAGQIKNIPFVKKETSSTSVLAEAKLIDDKGNEFQDENNDNNRKVLIYNDNWYLKNLIRRIPVPIHELLDTKHDSFTVKLFVDFGNASPEYIVPVLFDGKNYHTGNFKKLSGFENGNNGFMLLEFNDVKPSILTTAHLYYGNTSPNITYENENFQYKTIINNDQARVSGRWVRDRQVNGFYGADYLHDLNQEKGWKTLGYHPDLALDNYEVYAMYPSDDGFAQRVPVLVDNYKNTEYLELNQQLNGGTWNYIGAYTLDKDSYITIGNYGTRGVVVGDAFQFRKVSFYSSAETLERLIDGRIVTSDETESSLKDNVKIKNYTLSAQLNKTLSINLADYFEQFAFINYNSSNGLDLDFSERVLKVLPRKTGISNVTLDNNLKKINIFINVSANASRKSLNQSMGNKSHNKGNISGKDSVKAQINKRAVVNKPVSWSIAVKGNDAESISVPVQAENIGVYNARGRSVNFNFSINNRTLTPAQFGKIKEKLNLEKKLKNIKKKNNRAGRFSRAASFFREFDVKRKISNIDGQLPDLGEVNESEDASIALPKNNSGYTINYKTEAPRLKEGKEEFDNHSVKKAVKVYHNSSVHYHNVLTRVNITPAKPEQVNLFWKINNSRVNVIDDPRFNVTLIDDNNDGLVEGLEWNTPRLSEQNFEVVIDLTILNVQSYPSIQKNWTVMFNTTGSANLTITAINGTSWTEFFNDNSETKDDLNFMGLRCGNHSMASDDFYVILRNDSKIKYSNIRESDNYRVKSLFYENWGCNTTGYLTDQIITTGKHLLKFEFGNDVAYAKNMGLLLYETFESYSNQSKAPAWVDQLYDASDVDKFQVFDNSTSKFYRGDLAGNDYYSIYNESFAKDWQDYEISGKVRANGDGGPDDVVFGFGFYSDGNGNQYRLYAREDNTLYFYYHGNAGFGFEGDYQVTNDVSIGDWYNFKIRTNTYPTKTNVKAKLWQVNESEPGSWKMDVNHTNSPYGKGTVALYGGYTDVDFDHVYVENHTAKPELTIHSPRDYPHYNYSETVWFNVSMSKLIQNCSYRVDGGSLNQMKLLNDTYAYDSQIYGTYGERTVVFYCTDNMDYTVNGSRTFQVGTTPSGTFLNNGTHTTHYDFDTGSFTQTYFNDTFSSLMLNQSNTGSYESQVFDTHNYTAMKETSWENIFFGMDDFGELPDYGESDKYANMSENILLVHLNEDYGDIDDYSGYGNTGEAQGSFNYGFPSARRSLNASVDFGNSYPGNINFSSIGFSGDQPRTIAGWVKCNDISQNRQLNIFGFVGGANDEYFAIEMDGNGVCGGNGGYALNVGGSQWCIMDNWDTGWHHVAATYDGSNIRLYLDGQPGSDDPVSYSGLSTVDNFFIDLGEEVSSSGYYEWNGSVDEVAVWNRSLSQEEINDLYLRTPVDFNFSVRSCNKSDCSDSGYTHLGSNDGKLPLPNNRYIQYLYDVSTDNLDYSPLLYNVTLEYEKVWKPDSFYDNFKTTVNLSDYNNINNYVTSEGGVELKTQCLAYPFESGCWNYRREIEITETSGVNHTDYTFFIDFDGKSFGNKLQDNCGDLRVTYLNSSGEQESVYYWPEDGYCNTSDSRLWITAPKLGAGETQTYYMYYGNPSATKGPYEDGSNVFDFFDNFNSGSLDTSKWDDSPSGEYNFPAGEDYIEYWNPDDTEGWVPAATNWPSLVSQDTNFYNGTLRWRMLTDEQEGRFAGSVGIREPNNDDTPEGYFFMLDSQDTNINGIVEDAESTYLANFDELIPQGSWVRGQSITEGESLSFWTDFHDYEINANDATYNTAGRIELFCDSDSQGARRAGLDWIFFLERTEHDFVTSLKEEEAYYVDSGYLTSKLIEPEIIETWEYLTVNHNIPEDTNMSYKIFDKSNNLLCDFEVGEPITQYDVSGCAYGYDSLKIFSELNTNNASYSPLLNDWELSWNYRVLNTLDEPDEIYLTRFNDFYMNGSLYSDTDNCNISAYGQYKLTGQSAKIAENKYEDFSYYGAVENVSISDYLKLEADVEDGNLLDKGWRDRFKLTVSLNETRYNYPVEFTLTDSDIDFSKTDFSDIRVTYYNKSAGKEEVIPHWIQNQDSTSVTMWAKVPKLDTHNTDVYVYYDNPDAEDTSDPEQMFLYWENFDNVSDWQAYGVGVSIKSDNGIGKFNNPGGASRAWAVPDPAVNFTDFVLEMKYRTAGPGQEVGSLARIPGSPAEGEIDGYQPGTRGRTDDDYPFWRMDNGCDPAAQIGHYALGWAVDDSWYHGRLYASGANMEWYGDVYNHPSDFVSASDSTYSYGNIGVWQYDNSAVELDWLFVRPRASDVAITKEGLRKSYKSQGTYTSEEFDTTFENVVYGRIKWSEKIPTGTNMQVFTRTSEDAAYWSDWNLIDSGDELDDDGKRYIQYKVNFSSEISSRTPEFDDLSILYYKTTPSFQYMSSSDTTFGTSNPYECGIMNEDNYCFPEWASVMPKKRGQFRLRLLGEGRDGCSYKEASNEKIVYVFAETQINNLDSDRNVVGVTEDVTLTGTLTDDLLDPLGSRTIQFSGDGKYLGEVITDSQGDFSFTYKVPANWTIGDHDFTAEFLKDYELFYEPSSATTQVRISSKPKIHNITINPNPAGNVQTVTINSSVTDEVGVGKVYAIITKPDGSTKNVSMNDPAGDGNYTGQYAGTWRKGEYNAKVIAENIDGITTKSSATFDIEIYGQSNVKSNKDKFLNYENVLLDDTEWKYKQNITLSATQPTPVGYQVEIQLDNSNVGHNFDWSNNCLDIRFKNENENNLSYWVEECSPTGESATIWVKINSSIDASKTIYMYYGNPSAANESNASEVLDSGGLWLTNWQDGHTSSPGDEAGMDGLFSAVAYSGRDGWGVRSQVDCTNDACNIYGGDDNYLTLLEGWIRAPESGQYTFATDSDDASDILLQGNNWKSDIGGTNVVGWYGGHGVSNDWSHNGQINLNKGFHRYVYRHEENTVGDAWKAGWQTPSNTSIDYIPSAYLYHIKHSDADVSASYGAEENIQNGFFNTGNTTITGYRWVNVQRWDGSSWKDLSASAMINDRAFDNRKTISPNSLLGITPDWNLNPWNTDDYDPGWYRIRAALVDNSTSPSQASSVIVDSNSNRMETFYNFTIKESRLILNNITYPNLNNYGFVEYETGDTVDWIDVELKAINNTAIDVNTTFTLLDKVGVGYAGFGPEEEVKHYGNIPVDTTKTKRWDNSSSGYYIPASLVTGTYKLNWETKMGLQNGADKINKTEYVWIHNIPSTFNTSVLERLYINHSTNVSFELENLWTTDNITDVSVTINCPNIPDLNCGCLLSGQSGSNVCNLGEIPSNNKGQALFNLTADETAPSGDYYVNFTVNYTNPVTNKKSWVEVNRELLEIRVLGILAINDYYHDNTVIRGNNATFKTFVNNTNNTMGINDAWLNYTLIPDYWTVGSGSLSQGANPLGYEKLLWNNITFDIGLDADLGEQKLIVNSSGRDVKPDFKQLFIDVYGETYFDSFTVDDLNASRGEIVQLTARLMWDNGNPLSGETVYFYDQTNGTVIDSATTDSSGYASINYPIDNDVSLGYHTLNSTYEGNPSIYSLDSNISTALDIGLQPTINSVANHPDPVGYGINETITANITDDDEIDKAIVNITYPNGSTISRKMYETSSDIYKYNFNDTWFNGTYSYFVWTNDTTGSTDKSGVNTFTLEQTGRLLFSTNQSDYEQFNLVRLDEGSTWWNSSWKKKVPITLSSSSITEENYQVLVDLNSTNVGDNFDWGRSCEDIRFANSTDDGSLDFWIAECDSSAEQAKIWVEVDDNITSEHTIYMYYDNTGATSASSVSETFMGDQIFLLTGDSSLGSFSGGHEDVDNLRANIGTSGYAEHGRGYVSGVNHAENPYGGNDDYYSRYRFLFIADTTGTHGFGTKSDDESEAAYLPYDGYGDGISTSDPHPYGEHTILASQYDGWHNDDPCGNVAAATEGTMDMTAGAGYWLEYVQIEQTGGQDMIMCVDANNDGTYTTMSAANFPDQIYARKYITPEPTISIGKEKPISTSYTIPDMRGHLVMEVQQNTETGWDTLTKHVDQIASGEFTPSQDNRLNLSEVWNPNPWNTTNSDDGLYRIYAYMVDPYGNSLATEGDIINGSANFTILPPPVNVTLNTMRIYNTTSSTRYSGGALVDSGLNKTFNLFLNKSYRVEIELENQFDSSPWDISKTIVNHSKLNSSWHIGPSDIWFKVGSGSREENGSFTNGIVRWNTTGHTTEVPSNSEVTFYYSLNTTPISTKGDYPVKFELEDPIFKRTDNSLFHVIPHAKDRPKIYNNTYNVSEREVIRLFNSTKIFARWNQEIAEADVYYNATISPIISDDITLPSPNPYNWTNYTFTPSASWLLGTHVAKIKAKNPSDAWNDTLQYLDFNVYGLAYINDMSANASSMGIGESVEINCSVYDDSNSTRIRDYNVSIFSSLDGEIYNGLTDNQGQVSFTYTPTNYGIIEVTCNITEQGWYKTDSRYKTNKSIFVMEYMPPNYYDVDGPLSVHKTELMETTSRWTDNAELDHAYFEFDLNGSLENFSDQSISGNNTWANFSYLIPSDSIPGIYNWRHRVRDTSYNYNITPLRSVEVWGWSEIDMMNQTPGSLQLGNYTTSGCHVQDANSSGGLQNYNVSFWRNGVYMGWNLTGSNGWATFTFNDSTTGLHNIECNITDAASIYYNVSTNNEANESLNVVDSADYFPPYLLSYGINDTELMRYDCLEVYGQWNEEINYSRALYNKTDTITPDYISKPYVANWTNKTICIDDTWNVGTRGVRVWANDTSGNINNSVEFKNFNVTGRSAVEFVSPVGTVQKGEFNVTCGVVDNDTNENISGYTIIFYDYDSNNFASKTTDIDGKATALYDGTSLEGDYTFTCQIMAEGFYNTVKTTDDGTFTVVAEDTFLDIWDDTDLSTKYQHENITFYANYTDSSGFQKDGSCNLTIFKDSGNLSFNMSKNNISNLYEYNYSFAEKGIYQWNVTCNSSDSLPITRNDTVVVNDSVGPKVNIESPVNNSNLDYGNITFYYNVTDESGIENCSLILNGIINQTNSSVIENQSQNFTVNNMYPAEYNWSIRCYDNSSRQNMGESDEYNLTISGVIISLDWTNYSSKVFRGWNNIEYSVNVSAEGTIDAKNTSVIMEIPGGWSFAPGNVSNNTINISAGDTKEISWLVDIGEFAPFGNQSINVSSMLDVAGHNDKTNLTVKVNSIDLSAEIINPENNSCTFGHLNVVSNITNHNLINKSSVNITLLVNNSIVQTGLYSINENETLTLSFDEYILKNETNYNVSLAIYEPSDGNQDNNIDTIFISKYYRDVSFNYGLESVSDDNYNVTLVMTNNKNCKLKESQTTGLVTQEFTLIDNTPVYNETMSLAYGTTYSWYNSIGAYLSENAEYSVRGSGNYSVKDLYMIAASASR